MVAGVGAGAQSTSCTSPLPPVWLWEGYTCTSQTVARALGHMSSQRCTPKGVGTEL